MIAVRTLDDGRRTLRIGDGPIAVELTDPASALKLHEWNGWVFASGLFALHDTHGFPLAESIIECYRRRWLPCLNDFRACALRAGWSKETIERTIAEALQDAGSMIPVEQPRGA